MLKIVFDKEDMPQKDRMAFEKQLRILCEQGGWTWTGQGTDLTTGKRDITFVKEKT